MVDAHIVILDLSGADEIFLICMYLMNRHNLHDLGTGTQGVGWICAVQLLLLHSTHHNYLQGRI